MSDTVPARDEALELLKEYNSSDSLIKHALAVEAVSQWNRQTADVPPMVLVLKGAGTVVTDGTKLYVNATGNPGMATGGSGDVLTGLIAALTRQQVNLFDAACLGVYLHGLAGDLAAEERTQQGMIAGDLIDFLPRAIQRL